MTFLQKFWDTEAFDSQIYGGQKLCYILQEGVHPLCASCKESTKNQPEHLRQDAGEKLLSTV